MKLLHLLIALSATLLSAAAQTTNTAPIVGWCRSLSLIGGNASIPGGAAQSFFSTYDGRANYIQVDARYSLVSNELRPRVGVPGVYETDYAFYREVVGFVEVGNMVLRLPTTDADTNGVPDIVQVNRASFTPLLLSEGHQEAPQGIDFNPTGDFNRGSGADVGTYSMAWELI